MRDFRDRNSSPSPDISLNRKRLGGYLVDAGLLTPAQVDVALNDQKLTGMRFGEILAARGWVKQQTIEYLMEKVVLPEQSASKPDQPRKSALRQEGSHRPSEPAVSTTAIAPVPTPTVAKENSKQPPIRRDIPISKPLPSIGSSDGDVSWVG